ncbi:MAG TPA: PIN domain-containing protein [Thermoanaerobaculia bacterium]
MIVLVDTTIWSLALRRRPHSLSNDEKLLVLEWTRLVQSGEAVLIGPIRQEILSGIREERTFEAIRESLGDFRYLEIHPNDYDQAAHFFNRCRAHGIAGTSIDLLLCAVAHRVEVPVFTTDPDFGYYAPHTGIRLHQPPRL